MFWLTKQRLSSGSEMRQAPILTDIAVDAQMRSGDKSIWKFIFKPELDTQFVTRRSPANCLRPSRVLHRQCESFNSKQLTGDGAKYFKTFSVVTFLARTRTARTSRTGARVPNTCEHLRTLANTCEHLQTLANTCEHLRTLANTCEHLRTLANTCEQLRTLANTSEHLRTLANICEHWRTLANTCEHLRTLANTCEHLRTLANTCEHLRTLADTCEH